MREFSVGNGHLIECMELIERQISTIEKISEEIGYANVKQL
jgi:hypothetical protein